MRMLGWFTALPISAPLLPAGRRSAQRRAPTYPLVRIATIFRIVTQHFLNGDP